MARKPRFNLMGIPQHVIQQRTQRAQRYFIFLCVFSVPSVVKACHGFCGVSDSAGSWSRAWPAPT
jgi:hypothetical protein